MKNTKTFLKLGSSLFLGMGIILGSSIKSAEAVQNGQPNSAQCAKAKSATDKRCADEESSETCKTARKLELQRCGQARKPDSHSTSTCPEEITLQQLLKLTKGENVGGWVLDEDRYVHMPDTIEGLKAVGEFLKGEKAIKQIGGGSNKWCKYGSIPPKNDSYIILERKK